MQQHRASNRRRGAAAVEAAVSLPFVIMLFLGSLEISRAIMVQHTLQEAAQAAARVYSVQGTTQADAQAIVAASMQNTNIDSYSITFSPSTKPEVDTNLEVVTVTLSVNYSDISWTSAMFAGGSVVSGIAAMPADLAQTPSIDPTYSELDDDHAADGIVRDDQEKLMAKLAADASDDDD